MTVRGALLVALLGAALTPATASAASARTWAELRAALPDDAARRQAALQAFASSEEPSLRDRLRAARALAKRGPAKARLSALLLQAELQGVSPSRRAERRRAASLKKAARMAKRAKARRTLAQIGRALAGDRALAKLERETGRLARAQKRAKKRRAHRRRAAKPGASSAKALASSLSAYQALGDEPRAARARLALLLYAEAKGRPGRRLLREVAALVEGGAHRDIGPARAEAFRLATRVHRQAGRWREAAEASLSADRASARPPSEALSSSDSDPYRRSRESAALCRAALDEGVRCDRLEEEKWGARSFYDFSRGRRARRFSTARSGAVLAEYEGLLKDCVETSTQMTSFDTEVALTWKVRPDGRVASFEVRPRFLERGEFYACAEKAFARFRYPRFRGPSAEVSYTISVDG